MLPGGQAPARVGEELLGDNPFACRVTVLGRWPGDVPVEAVDRDPAVTVVEARHEPCQRGCRVGHQTTEGTGVKVPGGAPDVDFSREAATETDDQGRPACREHACVAHQDRVDRPVRGPRQTIRTQKSAQVRAPDLLLPFVQA